METPEQCMNDVREFANCSGVSIVDFEQVNAG